MKKEKNCFFEIVNNLNWWRLTNKHGTNFRRLVFIRLAKNRSQKTHLLSWHSQCSTIR